MLCRNVHLGSEFLTLGCEDRQALFEKYFLIYFLFFGRCSTHLFFNCRKIKYGQVCEFLDCKAKLNTKETEHSESANSSSPVGVRKGLTC